MANTMTLTNSAINSGTAVRLLGGEFSYSWQNLIDAPPTAVGFKKVVAQFSGWENPLINITFHIPVESVPSGTMTWLLWNTFVKNDTSTATTLIVTVGSNDTQFASYADTTTMTAVTSIPVVVKGYTLNFSPGDSRSAGFWTINAQLQETI